MTGWKTKSAAWLSVLYGVLGWVFDLHDISTGIDHVVFGLGLMGVGHKIEKAGVVSERIESMALDDVVRDNQRDRMHGNSDRTDGSVR